jgi:ribosome-binding factor A
MAKDSHRLERVEREIQAHVASYISRYITPLVGGILSVTRVKSNRELKSAKVLLSFLSSEKDIDEPIEILEQHRGDLQKYIAKNASLRYTPVLRFLPDESLEKQLKIESLLHEISTKS